MLAFRPANIIRHTQRVVRSVKERFVSESESKRRLLVAGAPILPLSVFRSTIKSLELCYPVV